MDEFQGGLDGDDFYRNELSLTFHVSFFSRNHYIRVKTILPFLLLTRSNFFCLIEYCFSNNPQVLQMSPFYKRELISVIRNEINATLN